MLPLMIATATLPGLIMSKLLTNDSDNMDYKDFFSVRDVCKILGFSELTIKRKIKAGIIKASKVNGKYQISSDALQEFISNSPKIQERIRKESADAFHTTYGGELLSLAENNAPRKSAEADDPQVIFRVLPSKDNGLQVPSDPDTIEAYIADLNSILSICELEIKKIEIEKRRAKESNCQDKVDTYETKILDNEIIKAKAERFINFYKYTLKQIKESTPKGEAPQ